MTKLHEVVASIQSGHLKSDLPEIRIGDIVRLGVSIQEGNKQRVQPFEGTVIARHQTGSNSTITVSKTLQGIGVETSLSSPCPLYYKYSSFRRAEVSRAKLYYLTR